MPWAKKFVVLRIRRRKWKLAVENVVEIHFFFSARALVT